MINKYENIYDLFVQLQNNIIKVNSIKACI